MGSGFSMNSLQLCEDANMLLVGTQTGDVSPPDHFAVHVCKEMRGVVVGAMVICGGEKVVLHGGEKIFVALKLVVRCSWLSRQSNTLMVSSSSLDIASQIDWDAALMSVDFSPAMSLMNTCHCCLPDSVTLPARLNPVPPIFF